MKTWLAKCLPLLFISITFMAGIQPAYADPQNKPYLKTFGADVMTGGWFRSGSACGSDPTRTNYQNPKFSNAGFAGDERTGGILTYTKSSGTASGGSSSQYGVISLGKVDDSAGSGFYSNGAQPATNVKTLSFANINSDGSPNGAFGGKYEGSIAQSNCIPDYFGTKQNNPSPCCNPTVFGDSIDLNNANGQYIMNPGAAGAVINPVGIAIPTGHRIVVFVDGNAYIPKNITYDPASTVSNVPKFTLIVKGSIYVDPAVTRLDGVYIAQPKDDTLASLSSDTGIFWSCHPQTGSIDIYYPPKCASPLVINGAVIAKQANLLRVKGDVGSSGTGEDSLSTVNNCMSGSCNVAEVFNYTPDIIIGGSFFDPPASAGSPGPLRIDNVISLPPVF
jgi:hypothetical protein